MRKLGLNMKREEAWGIDVGEIKNN